MNVLLFDGAPWNFSVAWRLEDRYTEHRTKRFAELVSCLDREEAWSKPWNVVGVTVGPGSYTGIRSILALARGICLGKSIPLWGFNLHDVWARQISGLPFFLLDAETRRRDRMVSIYREGEGRIFGPESIFPEKMPELDRKFRFPPHVPPPKQTDMKVMLRMCDTASEKVEARPVYILPPLGARTT